MAKIWFKTKLYGWGWTPATWQGWLTLFIYLGLNIFIFQKNDRQSHSVSDTLLGTYLWLFLSTITLLGVCLKKGEKPRWRWGK